jgi:hypothetical protein
MTGFYLPCFISTFHFCNLSRLVLSRARSLFLALVHIFARFPVTGPAGKKKLVKKGGADDKQKKANPKSLDFQMDNCK